APTCRSRSHRRRSWIFRWRSWRARTRCATSSKTFPSARRASKETAPMKCYGLHRGFSQFGISLFNMHDVWTPPGPVVKFAPGVMEGPAFMAHPGGWWLTHKVSKTVHFDGGPAIQQGHDAGYLIPHIPVIAAVPNLMLVIHMAVSKHKVMFPATRVLVDGKPMGMYAGKFLGSICSNPVSLPTGYLVKFSGTVVHDMTLEDFILGMALLLVDLVLDILWSKVMK